MKKNASFKKRNKIYFGKGREHEVELEENQNYDPLEEAADSDRAVFGVAIVHDLIERYRENKTFRKMLVIFIIVSVIRGMISFTYRDSTHFSSWIISIFISLGISYIYIQITAFFGITEMDIRRKIFLETQMGYMITPRKFGGVESEKKLYPTTNFLCPRHLRGWNLLRKIGRDYGHKYSLREANNLGWAAALYFFFTIILALDFFHIINLYFFVNCSEANSRLAKTLKIIMLFDVLFFFTLLMRQLLLGIKLNKFYKIHKSNFEEMQIFISDIARKTDWYFREESDAKELPI